MPVMDGEVQARTSFLLDGDFSSIDLNLQAVAAEADSKGIAFPILRRKGPESKAIIFDAQSAEAIDNGHPCSRHAGDVQPIICVVVVIVQI